GEEDVAKVYEERGGVEIETAGKRPAVAERGMAELVILRALLRIAEDGIRLRDFLEALLRVFVSGVAVGMILERQLAVNLFDLFFAGVTRYAEDFVIIALAVQFSPSSKTGKFISLYNGKAPLLNVKGAGALRRGYFPPGFIP